MEELTERDLNDRGDCGKGNENRRKRREITKREREVCEVLKC